MGKKDSIIIMNDIFNNRPRRFIPENMKAYNHDLREKI